MSKFICLLLLLSGCPQAAPSPSDTTDYSLPPILPDPISCPLEAPAPIPIEEWLKKSSFVDNASCTAAPVLYRGFHGGVFDAKHVLRSMMGDALAEIPSWRFSKLVSTNFPAGTVPTLTQYQRVKETALNELVAETKNDVPICEFGRRSALQTLVGQSDAPTSEKWKSYGIPTSSNYDEAALYANGFSPPQDKFDIQGSLILQILEKVPRAAKAIDLWGGNEYYVPIVIPADDISGAWFPQPMGADHYHFIEKAYVNQQIEIRIHHQAGFKSGWTVREDGFPGRLPDLGPIEGRIVACPAKGPCVSDAVPDADSGLKRIVDSIPDCRINGISYRYES